MAKKAKAVTEEVKKEEATVVEETAEAEKPKYELTKDELEALLRKKEEATRQQIAMAQAKAEAKKQLAEEAEAAKNANLSDLSTRTMLNQERKYKVVVYPAEGEKNGDAGVININGVKFRFKYGEETVLPESALDILKNSKTFGQPKLVKDVDGAHYEPVRVQKRAYNATEAYGNTKLKMD